MTTSVSGLRRIAYDVRRDWREIGRPGRIALIGVVGSALIAVALGFSITRAARGHLLDARADLLVTVSSDLGEFLSLPLPEGSAEYEQFEEEVRLRLLGGETVRVKLWTADGKVAYSDSPDLVGRTFALSERAQTAFAGTVARGVSDLSEPAHAHERYLGSLIEFYIPIAIDRGGAPIAVFEVEQDVTGLEASLASINRNVWISIATGIGLLGLFLGLLFAARTRDLHRRRRQAEDLLASLFRAQEEERKRIVGALHDDVGQPLYRMLYGLEGIRSKLDAAHPVHEEVVLLEELVRAVDATLRAELEMLHQGLAEVAGLDAALTELVDTTKAETGLDVSLELADEIELAPVRRTALFRAAQEAVVNARKHSATPSIAIVLGKEAGRVTLRVIDDGVGWSGESGLGLATTRDRLEALGGGLDVESRPGGGTMFAAWLPMEGAD